MHETKDFKKIEITCLEEVRDWLSKNHESEDSYWLITYKKDTSPEKYVSRLDILDELVAFGWIDGIRRKLDDERTMQLISRRKQQNWTKSYRERADKLIKEERMQPPGFASIEEAKRNGTYITMEDVDSLRVPMDLKILLNKEVTAERYFAACPPSYRRNILRWLASAKKTETRSNRILKTVEFCSREERIPNY
jgi:uncharacterized protein YdeI (YjbR/CyaY-like superfamily)